jgi:hypothetical protein
MSPLLASPMHVQAAVIEIIEPVRSHVLRLMKPTINGLRGYAVSLKALWIDSSIQLLKTDGSNL